jgi:hypothetical protein
MNRTSPKRLALPIILCLALLAFAPAANAGEKWFPQFHRNPDRHMQRIHRKLSRYKPHTYLHLVMLDKTQEDGTVATLSDKSFTFTNADSNALETRQYKDIAKVYKAKAYIGQGTAPRRHIHLF